MSASSPQGSNIEKSIVSDDKGGDAPYMALPGFIPNHDMVFHGFFGREGGVSKDLYESLNCGRGSKDEGRAVLENLNVVGQSAGLPDGNSIQTMHQIHSAICTPITQILSDRPQCDALVTDRPGIGLGVLTADCTPVLFYGEKDNGAPVIGVAHAGWKGALGGVLEDTVQKMRDLGAGEATIRAAIGPCIAQKSYEVGAEFPDPFIEEDADNERFFMPSRTRGHHMFDLAGYCSFKLAKAGVPKIIMSDIDTYSNEGRYFSYRRTTHRKEPDYGRQISLIFIKA